MLHTIAQLLHSSCNPVSTLLEWKEVKPRLKPKRFDIYNMAGRLKKKCDLWKDVLDKKVAGGSSKILKKFM